MLPQVFPPQHPLTRKGGARAWNSQLLRYAGHRMADMYASGIASATPCVLKLLSCAPNNAVTAVVCCFALPAYVAFQHTPQCQHMLQLHRHGERLSHECHMGLCCV